jgi:hypothetical protein
MISGLDVCMNGLCILVNGENGGDSERFTYFLEEIMAYSWRTYSFIVLVFAMTMFFVKEIVVKTYYELAPVSHFVDVHNWYVGKATVGKQQLSILDREVKNGKVYSALAQLDLMCKNGNPQYTFYPEHTITFKGSFEFVK